MNMVDEGLPYCVLTDIYDQIAKLSDTLPKALADKNEAVLRSATEELEALWAEIKGVRGEVDAMFGNA